MAKVMPDLAGITDAASLVRGCQRFESVRSSFLRKMPFDEIVEGLYCSKAAVAAAPPRNTIKEAVTHRVILLPQRRKVASNH